MMAFAICDTDGGRREPAPLARHIYGTRDAARTAQRLYRFDPEHYPVRPVRVEVELGGKD